MANINTNNSEIFQKLKNISWLIKYKPTSINEFILPNHILNEINSDGLDRHYLLHSSPGTGKTTFASELPKIFNQEVHIYNASFYSSVEHLKEEIFTIVKTTSILNNKKKKVIVLDEMDGVSTQYKKALRGIMNDSNSSIFILTTNKDLNSEEWDAIKSRCRYIDFSFKNDRKEIRIKMAKRMWDILGKENLIPENITPTEEKEWKTNLLKIIDEYFPDFREVLKYFEIYFKVNKSLDFKSFNTYHKKSSNNDPVSQSDKESLFNLLFNDSNNVDRDFLTYLNINWKSRVDDAFLLLQNNIFTELKQRNLLGYIANAVIIINKYENMRKELIDPIFALNACIYELLLILPENSYRHGS